MNPGAFLELLWGERPPGFIHLWELGSRTTTWLPGSDTASMARGAEPFAGRPDVYCSVAACVRRGDRRSRIKAHQAAAIAGLWVDVDVRGPSHTTGLPSIEAAVPLVGSVIEPTVIVDSGWGVHAWWLLRTPWRFTARAEQNEAASLARRIHAAHRLGATHDLARVMRLPGTVNAKVPGQPREVTVLRADGPRYTTDELRAALAGVADPGAHVASAGAQSTVTPQQAMPPEILARLLSVSEEFAGLWHHTRRLTGTAGDQSASAYDLALCALCVRSKPQITDEELSALITAHRLHHNPADTKHLRAGYVRDTIAKARSRRAMTEHIDALTAAAAGERRAA